ncbi:hypothetical protein RGI145_19575 [Roseomonas gilardii]|uniref:Uncharacterized protein n=1 Tax=Roseomonas gilardii TaxID=257708 RepID=A0A1L7AL88_9PROT|nr:hypothetical protein [Roseomonas gilardii]APT59548.1 hypothetical protein RGI145_19575 [Roseomonas gilardii]
MSNTPDTIVAGVDFERMDTEHLVLFANALLTTACQFALKQDVMPALRCWEAARKALSFAGIDLEISPLTAAVHYYIMSVGLDVPLEDGEIAVYHPFFAQNVGALVPGATIVNIPNHPEGKCDFLLDCGGHLRPVEIKRGDFDWKAKRQLRGYMDFYGADHGYAAAPRLKCKLDADMTFLHLDLSSPTGEAH